MSPFHCVEGSQETIFDSLFKNGISGALMFIDPSFFRALSPSLPQPFDLPNLGAGSQHDGEPPCVFITFKRDLNEAGHGHREDHTNRSQNPSPEDQ